MIREMKYRLLVGAQCRCEISEIAVLDAETCNLLVLDNGRNSRGARGVLI